MYAPNALSLSDAVNDASQHEERNTWGQASQIKLVPGINYPNQPVRNPGSHLSDPLTYWWGVTLCPPELNDVSLAENVVILMRYAAIQELNLSTEVQKPSIADVLEFRGPRMECADESTLHEETRIYSSIVEGGNVMQKFEEDGSKELHIDEEQRDRPDHIQSGLKEDTLLLLTHGQGTWIRKRETLREYRKGNPTLIEDKAIDGTSVVSHLPQLPQRHTSQVNS